MSKTLVVVVALFALLLSACGTKSYALPEDKRLKIVATAYPLFEAAASIGSSRVHAVDLLPLDPFGQLTDEQKSELQNADLVLTLGKGTQPNVDTALKGRTGPTVDVLDQFPTQQMPVTGGVDPYVWENPQNMIGIETTVRDRLSALDPAGAPLFTKHSINLRADLNKLDSTFIKTIATCQSETVVANVDNRFGYLTSHYGLKYVVVGLNQSYPVGVDPLRQAIDQNHPTTVFALTLPSLSTAKAIEDKYGVRVATMDPIIGQTDQARRGGSNYAEVMSLDFAAIKGALGCAATVSSSK